MAKSRRFKFQLYNRADSNGGRKKFTGDEIELKDVEFAVQTTSATAYGIGAIYVYWNIL